MMILWFSSVSVVMFSYSFWFYLFEYCLSAFWVVWQKLCLSYWFSQRTSSWFHWFFVLFSLFLIDWFQPWVWLFPAIYSFWMCLLLFILELSGELLNCSLISLWRHIVPWIFLSELLLMCSVSLGMLCIHFYWLLENL